MNFKHVGYTLGLGAVGAGLGAILGHEISSNNYYDALYHNINEILNNPELKKDFDIEFEKNYRSHFEQLKNTYNDLINQKQEILKKLEDINNELSSNEYKKGTIGYDDLYQQKINLQHQLNNLNLKISATENYAKNADKDYENLYKQEWNKYKNNVENTIKTNFNLYNSGYIDAHTKIFRKVGGVVGMAGGHILYKRLNQDPQAEQVNQNQQKTKFLSESIEISYKTLKG